MRRRRSPSLKNQKPKSKRSKPDPAEGDPGEGMSDPFDDFIIDTSRHFFREESPEYFALLKRFDPSLSESGLLANCERLLRENKLREVIVACEGATISYPKNLRFTQLEALAFLRVGDVSRARYLFSQIILRGESGPTILVPYVANCLCAARVATALEVIHAHYASMNAASKRLLFEVIEECLSLGLVESPELPSDLNAALGLNVSDKIWEDIGWGEA